MTTVPPRRTQLGPSGRYLLRLIACCPRIPTGCVHRLLRHRSEASTRQLLARISAAGLIYGERATAGSVLGGGTLRMWSLTKMGGHAVADLGEAAAALTLLDAVTRTGRRRGQSETTLVAAYRALAATSAIFASRPTIRAWQQPWVRVYQSPHDRLQQVRLPAGVVFESAPSVLHPPAPA
jgi:hypothetical protein